MENLSSVKGISSDKAIYLSPSALSLFKECPLCFWLEKVMHISRPKGPESTLPRGLDNLIKKHFDKYRALGELPPEIANKVQRKLISGQNLLNEWRKTTKK